jgi:hypothetical protein
MGPVKLSAMICRFEGFNLLIWNARAHRITAAQALVVYWPGRVNCRKRIEPRERLLSDKSMPATGSSRFAAGSRRELRSRLFHSPLYGLPLIRTGS